jgi:hypothetical protein
MMMGDVLPVFGTVLESRGEFAVCGSLTIGREELFLIVVVVSGRRSRALGLASVNSCRDPLA